MLTKIECGRTEEQEIRKLVDGYKAALLAIEGKITTGQRKMLQGHFAAPEMRLSVMKLGELAGYKGAAPGKLHYGKFARKISEATGWDRPTIDQLSAIAQWDPSPDERGHGNWIMYDEFAQALMELNLVNHA